MIYEIYASQISGIEFIKRFNKDGSESWVPTDPANSDYQAYLATLASESAKKLTES